MTEFLYLDTETFSKTPIRCGTHRYAEDCEIMIVSYAFGGGGCGVTDLANGREVPEEIIEALTSRDFTKVMHNSAFDRTVIRHCMGIDIPTDQIHDTMVQAYLHALPGSLDALCSIFGIGSDKAKIKEGKSFINLFCKPRGKNVKINRATKQTHPEKWAKFLKYALNDISAMRAIHKVMPMWNYTEFEKTMWQLDQKMNDRGFAVDVELARTAMDAISYRQDGLAEEIQDITRGVVSRATQIEAFMGYMKGKHDVDLPDLKKDTVEKAIAYYAQDTEVTRLLTNRQEASATSTAKYKSLIDSVSSDNRLRGTLQFSGASRTRRWSARTWQPQNLPRPTHPQKDIDFAIDAFKQHAMGILDPDNIISLASSAIRGCIVASEGKRLVISDLSNIEGRVSAWLGNEEWKLKAFRDFDNGIGEDLYKVAYSKAFNIPVEEVTKDQRQIGKTLELSFGYAGGVGAFANFGDIFGINYEELYRNTWPTIPTDIQEETERFYKWMMEKKNPDFGLTEMQYRTCDALKRMWRNSHPGIVSIWGKLYKGAVHGGEAGKVKFVRDNNWTRCALPSGHSLCYPGMSIKGKQISYKGVDQFTRKWGNIKTFSGKLMENCAQSIARDVMAYNMQAIEDAGYNILLTVHDELITEVPDTGEYSVEHLSELLATPPPWAEDLPLAAAGFEAYRYRKD